MSVSIPELLEPIKALHRSIRDAVIAACEAQSVEDLSRVVQDEGGDTIFHIDRISEEVLVEHLERDIACHTPLILIAEGLGVDGIRVLPEGAETEDAVLRIIVDPIDGTRGLMFQKRSAWILTGVAPNRGPETCLADITMAVQTEIPLLKQHVSDTFWAIKGQGASGERCNRFTGETQPLSVSPSTATLLENGFVTVARYFPGAQQQLGELYDAWMEKIMGPPPEGKAQCYEDQYISSAGHLAELMVGHDRVVADVRPLMGQAARGLCSHPYDLCTELIAREAGVMVTDMDGSPLQAPMDVNTDVAWVGVANQALFEAMMPALREILAARGLSHSSDSF